MTLEEATKKIERLERVVKQNSVLYGELYVKHSELKDRLNNIRELGKQYGKGQGFGYILDLESQNARLLLQIRNLQENFDTLAEDHRLCRHLTAHLVTETPTT